MPGPETFRARLPRITGKIGLAFLIAVDLLNCVDFINWQINFDLHLKRITEMTEIGETVERIDSIITETKCFQTVCEADIERAENVVAIGMIFLLLLSLYSLMIHYEFYQIQSMFRSTFD